MDLKQTVHRWKDRNCSKSNVVWALW